MTEEIELSADTFASDYRPIVNPFTAGAPDDFGYGGTMFETFGEEWEFVKKARSENSYKIWTRISDETGDYIISGLRVVNRLGYYITENPCPPDTDIYVSLEG